MTNAIQLINIARAEMGLDDDTYRAKLFNLVGERSLRKMTDHQLQKVLLAFKNDGFAPKPGGSKRSPAATLSGRFAAPIRAFWLSGYNLGVFRARDDRAILTFAKGQTGLEHVQFAVTAAHGKSIIEAIKAIVRREAQLPDLWRPVGKLAPWRNDGRVQVLFGQWEVLRRLCVVLPDAKLTDWRDDCDRAMAALDGPALIEMQQALGQMIRKQGEKT